MVVTAWQMIVHPRFTFKGTAYFHASASSFLQDPFIPKNWEKNSDSYFSQIGYKIKRFYGAQQFSTKFKSLRICRLKLPLCNKPLSDARFILCFIVLWIKRFPLQDFPLEIHCKRNDAKILLHSMESLEIENFLEYHFMENHLQFPPRFLVSKGPRENSIQGCASRGFTFKNEHR